MILFNHMFVCYFFPRERKEKTDNPLTIPISSSVCGTMVTPASDQWQSWPSQIQPTNLFHFDYVISCHFLCRLAWSVFASWFCIFADSRGIVTFCNIRFWFRLWGYTHFPLSSPCDLSCVTSALHHWRMDGCCFFLSLSPHDAWSVACPIQAILYLYSPSVHSSSLTCLPVLADYHFTLITSVPSWLIFRHGYSLLLFLLLLLVLTTVSLS